MAHTNNTKIKQEKIQDSISNHEKCAEGAPFSGDIEILHHDYRLP